MDLLLPAIVGALTAASLAGVSTYIARKLDARAIEEKRLEAIKILEQHDPDLAKKVVETTERENLDTAKARLEAYVERNRKPRISFSLRGRKNAA